MANKYSKKIRLGASTLDKETKKFQFEIETSYLGVLNCVVDIYASPKSTQGGSLIIGNIDIDWQQIPIRENEYNGNKKWSATLSRDEYEKGNAWANVNKVISANPNKEYEFVIVEKEQEEKKMQDIDDPDLPF